MLLCDNMACVCVCGLVQGSAGLEDQDALKKFIKVKKEVTVTRDDAYATIKPFDGFKVSFKVSFDHPVHKKLPSESIIDFSSTSFVKEV